MFTTEEEQKAEEEAEKGLMKQWDEQMNDFFPEKMLTLDIFGKSDEVFYHDVSEGQRLNIRGAYFTGDPTNQDRQLDFYILD